MCKHLLKTSVSVSQVSEFNSFFFMKKCLNLFEIEKSMTSETTEIPDEEFPGQVSVHVL